MGIRIGENTVIDNSRNVTANTITGDGSGITDIDVFTTGMIMMFNGDTAPSGWAFCDGANSTPDLRDRFVIGSGSSYSRGNTGGSANAVVVSHSHDVTDPGHTHTMNFNQGQIISSGGAFGLKDSGTADRINTCLLYTSPSPRDKRQSRMPSSA